MARPIEILKSAFKDSQQGSPDGLVTSIKNTYGVTQARAETLADKAFQEGALPSEIRGDKNVQYQFDRLNAMVDSQVAGIDVGRFKDVYDGKLPDTMAKLLAVDAKDKINSKFQAQYGRPISQKEFEVVFQGMPVTDINSSISNRFKELAPKFALIQQANLNLKNIDQALPEDLSYQILNDSTSLETAAELSNAAVSSAREGSVNKSLAGLPEEDEKALRGFEDALNQSSGRFFEQEITPGVTRNLSARGLLDSGDFASALASEAGKLGQRVQDVVAPIRFETKQNTRNMQYQNILRGALESGRSLSDAVSFTRGTVEADRARRFATGEREATQGFQDQMFRQQQALQLALNSAQPQEKSGMDLFLQYGLPALGNFGGQALGGYLSRSKSGGG